MRVFQISVHPHQHNNKCIADFLYLWFLGSSPGDNPIARGLKYGIAPKVKLTKADFTDLVRKGFIYYNQKKVPHLPFEAKGKCKIIVLLPDSYFAKPVNIASDKLSDKISEKLSAKLSDKITAKNIVFEDSDMVIINKPSGLPSQSTLDIFEDHALSQLMSYYLLKNQGLKAPYLNLMHRLDKDTSGLLMFSKKISANKNLTALFETRKIQKTYVAVAQKTKPLNVGDTFKVSGFIKKDPQPGMSFYFSMDDHEGQTSETDFKIITSTPSHLGFECSPKTGRSHQIRVHLKSVGFPILGDVFYNPKSNFKRLMLHAWRLQFKHPTSGAPTVVTAPLPQEFIDIGIV